MKITFFLNMMGVASLKWYENNNIPYICICEPNRFAKDGWIERKKYDKTYYCGRIDVHGVPDEPYGLEYGVDVMEGKSWGKLQNYLSKLKLDYLPTKQELLEMFEKETNHKIKWFYKDNREVL